MFFHLHLCDFKWIYICIYIYQFTPSIFPWNVWDKSYPQFPKSPWLRLQLLHLRLRQIREGQRLSLQLTGKEVRWIQHSAWKNGKISCSKKWENPWHSWCSTEMYGKSVRSWNPRSFHSTNLVRKWENSSKTSWYSAAWMLILNKTDGIL